MSELIGEFGKNKWMWFFVFICLSVLFFRPVDEFSSNYLHPTPTPAKVVGSVATPIPLSIATAAATITNASKDDLTDETFPVFEADIRSNDGLVYWPFTSEENYQSTLNKGLAIRCYNSPDASVKESIGVFPNGMPVETLCPFYRVTAFNYGYEIITAVSVMRSLPKHGEVP